MEKMNVIAIADFHNQPPFETQAFKDTKAQAFDVNTSLEEVLMWAHSHYADGPIMLRLVETGK